MIHTDIDCVVNCVVRRAQRQGYVVPRDVRGELTKAGLPDAAWKEVLDAARASLHYRQGRYYFIETISPRLREQQSHQQMAFHTLRELVRRHQAAEANSERRQQDRVDFIYPVRVKTEDNREFGFVTRDVSPTGVRLLGNRSLLGQKVQIHLAEQHGGRSCTFEVRILWSCAIGDDLFENGGAFLGVIAQNPGAVPKKPAHRQ